MVFQNIFHFYRAKRPKSYMKCYMGNLNTFCLNLFQEFRCKMKSCCWCGCRTGVLCIYRLITVFIFQLMCNVRRKRHLPKLIQDFFKNSFIMELNQTISFLHYINDFSYKQSISEADLCSRLCFLSRFHKCLPHIIFLSLQKQYFNFCFCPYFSSDQSCRNYFRIIDNKTISRI